MAKKLGIFGRANQLATTTLEKVESLTYETLQTLEYGSKAITNVMEEFHNDTLVDVIDSRVAVSEKIAEANNKLKALGYEGTIIDGMLVVDRRPNL